MNRENIHFHIILLVGFTILFFALLFLSAGTTGISTNYKLLDESEFTGALRFDTYVHIGSVDIQSTKFLPSKLKLNNYVACQFFNGVEPISYDVRYVGANSGRYDMTLSYNSQQFIELESNEKVTLQINMQSFSPYRVDSKPEIETLDNTNVTFYIFSLDAQDSYYEACSNLNRDEAIKTINVYFDVVEDEKEQ